MQQTRKKNLVVLAVGSVVIVAYLALVAVYWTQVNDDAFITFRYSKFLTLGNGPYFNVGEHVEGYTNFLMMLLMAGAISLFGDQWALPCAKLIGVGAGIVAIVSAWALCARWLRKIDAVAARADLLAWGAAGLVAVNCAFAFNSTTGLETTLFSALLMLGYWLVQLSRDTQKYRGAGAAFALAALTRPEGAYIFAAVFLGRLLIGELREKSGRRALLIDALIVGGAVAAHMAFRYAAYDGELLPNTFYAKHGGFSWGLTPTAYVLGFGYSIMGVAIPLLAFLPLLARNRAIRSDTLPVLLAACASVVAIYLGGADWMRGYRLLIPHAPAWSALALCGVIVVVDRIRGLTKSAVIFASLLLAPALFCWQTPMRQSYQRYSIIRARGYAVGHAALADWLAARTTPGETVALMDIGIVGYRCPDLRILDITGLTDRYIAKSPGGFLSKEFDPAYVFDRAPEYIIIAAAAPDGPLGQEYIARLDPWTGIEARLLEAPEFRARYVHPVEPEPGARGLQWLAAVCGAEAVFHHDHPTRNYLLLAYRRHER